MTDRPLEHMYRLVGTWTTAATHPASPGLIVRGTAIVEWLEGERFLVYRARNDHADFPDSISIIGVTDRDRVESAPTDDPPAAEARLSTHHSLRTRVAGATRWGRGSPRRGGCCSSRWRRKSW